VKPRYFIGVDGGATRCRARLRDAFGRMLAQAIGPAADIYVDFEAGISVVRDVVDQTIVKADLAAAAQAQFALGLGLADVADSDDAKRVADALSGWARVEAANDAVTACIGANGAGDGGPRLRLGLHLDEAASSVEGRGRTRRRARGRAAESASGAGRASGRKRQLRAYRTLKLKIPASPVRPHFVKARVKVRVHPDGAHALFHGHRCIGRYDPNGAIRDAKNAA